MDNINDLMSVSYTHLLAVFLYNSFMNNIENLGLIPYLNSQLASAWRMAADSSRYAETPEQYLCKTINMSLKTCLLYTSRCV